MHLNHLHLHVRDLDTAVDFYGTAFGLEVHQRYGELVFMTDGAGFDLALMQDDDPGEMPSWFHFGFGMASETEVERAWTALTQSEMDVEVVRELTDHGDYVDFRVADPDGYVVEVYFDGALAEV